MEQVHTTYACKKVLSVCQKTPNSMMYGELGRHPLYINTLVKAAKYWLKLVELPYGRLSKAAYGTLNIKDEKGTSTWVTEIRTTIFRFGFGIIWVSQREGNQARFILECKQRLADCSTQGWHDTISTSERFERYRKFRQSLGYEGYLSWHRPKTYRDVTIRFRPVINNLCCNKYRYSTNLQLRVCPLC